MLAIIALLLPGCGHKSSAKPAAKAATRLGPTSAPVVIADQAQSMTVVMRNAAIYATVPHKNAMGGPILAKVVLKNVGRVKTISGYVIPTENNFIIEVLDAEGAPAPRIAPKVTDEQTETRETVLPSLLPGETVTASYDLGKLFYLAPGDYLFLAASNMAGEVPDHNPVIVRVPFSVYRP